MKISGRQYLDFVANNDTSNNGEYYALRKGNLHLHLKAKQLATNNDFILISTALSTEIRKANSIINKVLMEATNMVFLHRS